MNQGSRRGRIRTAIVSAYPMRETEIIAQTEHDESRYRARFLFDDHDFDDDVVPRQAVSDADVLDIPIWADAALIEAFL